eukprot:TRINITY_DN10762_c0_g1_i2.p1 TRINITY_DN10762_c0_g1~~TRINITY_DN10762_c0_g1_i2.p1  ORF type:complete len:173 (+),score=26.18 TRINITY_DN10762_c0_g1_i2:43-561(+)
MEQRVDLNSRPFPDPNFPNPSTYLWTDEDGLPGQLPMDLLVACAGAGVDVASWGTIPTPAQAKKPSQPSRSIKSTSTSRKRETPSEPVDLADSDDDGIAKKTRAAHCFNCHITLKSGEKTTHEKQCRKEKKCLEWLTCRYDIGHKGEDLAAKRALVRMDKKKMHHKKCNVTE